MKKTTITVDDIFKRIRDSMTIASGIKHLWLFLAGGSKKFVEIVCEEVIKIVEEQNEAIKR